MSYGEKIPETKPQETSPVAKEQAAPYPGARKAPDGNWYIQKPDGKYYKVVI
jgi:hypothetical protein